MSRTLKHANWKRVYRVDAWANQKGRCCYCHRPVKRAEVTAEHVTPASKHGPTTRENIAAACVYCNSARGNMSVPAFKKLLRNPPPGDLDIRLIAAVRNINLAADRSVKRILRAGGVA